MSDAIKAALQKLDPKNDNHWTAEGLPRIETVRMMTGNAQLTREDVTNADPEFSRTKMTAPPAPPVPPAPIAAAAPPVMVVPAAPAAPAPVVKSIEILFDEANQKLDAIRADKVKIDQAFADQQAVVDKLRVAIDAKKPPLHKQVVDTVQAYLASQNAARTARGERWAEFKKTGLTLKDILPQRAPVDQARQRKTGR